MCPPKTAPTKTETIHTGTEIEVKPPENCLTYSLQVIFLPPVIALEAAEERVGS